MPLSTAAHVRTIQTDNIPILVWGPAPDEGTLAQAMNLARLPFAFRNIALMPDTHVGFGMPIGGVLATEGQVIPHAVGLDIGCGVMAWRTGVHSADFMEVRDTVLVDIQRSIPQGHYWRKQSQAERTNLFDDVPDIAVIQSQVERAVLQLGTLGGGNHFIELAVDSDGELWAMVHSGSRNLGKQVAEHFDALARAENVKNGSSVPVEWGLAHLAIGSVAGEEYLAAMNWCLHFATENRRLMAEDISRVLSRHLGAQPPAEVVAIHHNYAAEEVHDGRRVIVHRKGAVHACGTVIVPGSMGTASYVGEGLCERWSFESCSHGAGRSLGRKEALRTFSKDQVYGALERAGVKLVTASKKAVAEEAPGAYKDIHKVMEWQSDLVRGTIRLTPVGVVKG